MDRMARTWLCGFLLLGIVVGLPGPLFVSWQYHIDVDPRLIGLHFLALNGGYLLAAFASQRLVGRRTIRTLALGCCVAAFALLLALAFASPPAPVALRLALIGLLGASAGGLATALLHALEPGFARSPSAALARAGLWFGAGCLFTTITVALTYFAGPVRIETGILATVPLVSFLVLARSPLPAQGKLSDQNERDGVRHSLRDLRTVAMFLFSLLLFFQFGSEWTIAGWLPLFTIHRTGGNPVVAITILALYFLALALGRLAASRILSSVGHRKLLVGSNAAAVAGCCALSFSSTLPMLVVSTAVVGLAFAPIYPLLAEFLDERFSYHPRLYGGAVLVAISGALSVPWLLGFLAASTGMRYLMLVPAAGSLIVLLLALLLIFEAHLMGSGRSLELEPALGRKR